MTCDCMKTTLPGDLMPVLGSPCRHRRAKVMTLLLLLLALLLPADAGYCADAAGPTDYQVKALVLLNFTKYVEWPEEAIRGPNEPLVIGVIGESKIGDDLKKAVMG